MKNIHLILRALANEKRIAILRELGKAKTLTVNEISDAIRLSPQGTSKHLSILYAAGIVEQKKRGIFVTYRLSLEQNPIVKVVMKEI